MLRCGDESQHERGHAQLVCSTGVLVRAEGCVWCVRVHSPGVLLFALDQNMAVKLCQQFKDRTVSKRYCAVVRSCHRNVSVVLVPQSAVSVRARVFFAS